MADRLDVASRLKSPTRHALTLTSEFRGSLIGWFGAFAERCGVP